MAHSSKTTRAMRDGYPSLKADPKTGMRPGYKEAAEEAGINHWAPSHPYEMEGRVYAQYGDLLRKGWRPVLAAGTMDDGWGLLGWMHRPQRQRLNQAAERMRTQCDEGGVLTSVFDGSFTVAVYDATTSSGTLGRNMYAGVEQPTEDIGGKLVFTRKPPVPPMEMPMAEVQGLTYGITCPRDVEHGLQPIATGLVRYACPDGSAGMMVQVEGPDGTTGIRPLPQGWGSLMEAIVDGMDEGEKSEKFRKNENLPLTRPALKRILRSSPL